jgi:cell division protein ZapA (FtsZ GTPase activity inhibitor)
MRIFRDYSNIGKEGTPEQIMRTFNKIKDFRFLSTPDNLDYLFKGALEAFDAGRPENVQTFMQNLSEIEPGIDFRRNNFAYFVSTILYSLSEKAEHKEDVIDLAMAKVSEEDKKRVLNHALGWSVVYYSGTPFIETLLRSGAQANAEIHGSTGYILAMASKFCDPATVETMYKNGASFDEALLYIVRSGYSAEEKQKLKSKLKFYKETMTKADDLQKMREQIRDLKEEVTTLKKASASPKAGPPPVTVPREKKLVPRIF